MNICPEPKNQSDWRTVLESIPAIYQQLAQRSYGIPLGLTPADTLGLIINKTLSLSDPAEIVGAAYKLFSPSACYNWQSGLVSAVSSIQTEPFDYLTCAYMPESYWSIGPGTIFPAMDIEDGAMGEMCKKRFNITIPTMKELQQRYKFTPKQVLNSRRMLFVTNEYDPTTACAPIDLLSKATNNPDRNATRMLYVQNTGHGEDSFSPAGLGNLTLRSTALQAQNEELQTIKGWLWTWA